MTRLLEVHLSPQPISRFLPILGPERVRETERIAAVARTKLAGRVVWNVSSTARGGGVAEMLSSLLAYVRGAGIDVRWLVINGSPEFFHLTKRLHHALHGSRGDGSALGERERAVYERVLRPNAKELGALVRPRDIVILHDPQTAGLAPSLVRAGVVVVWRCHIGHDEPNEHVAAGWSFLRPYLEDVSAYVFTRASYAPDWCDRQQTAVIRPSIDAFSAKNQELSAEAVRAILVHTGLVEGPPGDCVPTFTREDGTPGRVDRQADVVRLGRAPTWDTPLVVQTSRWDPLKDHLGVMRGFARLVDHVGPAGAELVLAGPVVTAVTDDPEGASTYGDVIAAWRQLSHSDRRRVHLVCLPMADVEENAAIVNALQRHATVVVQKSIREGFGLTVTEAMWKARPIVASAVGGIQDQIVDGTHGLLVADPTDLRAFGAALQRLLEDPSFAERLGASARERVRDQYLGPRHLVQYAELLERVEAV